MNLILVVLIFGILSGILSGILAGYFAAPSVGGYLSWIAGALLFLAAASSYTLVLVPQVVEAAIYINILIDEKAHQIYESRYAPPASQIAALLFKPLLQEDKELAEGLIRDLGRSDPGALAMDLLEYLVFEAISAFDPFWASPRVETFGRPKWSGRALGEKLSYKPSSVLRMVGKKEGDGEKEIKAIKTIDMVDQFKPNRIVAHFFAGTTKLDYVYQPANWMIWVPKRMELTIARETARIIMLQDPYAQLTVTLSRASTGIGLPYGISNKESEYNEFNYSTSDFRLDFRFELRKLGRIFSFLPMIDSYLNWSDKIKRSLINNFALED